MSHSRKIGYLFYHSRGGRINIALPVMVEVFFGQRTNHSSSNKVGCWLGGGDFVSFYIRLSSISLQLRGKSEQTSLDYIKSIFSTTFMTIRSYHPLQQNSESGTENMMEGFSRIRVTIQHPPWCHIGVGTICLVLTVFYCSQSCRWILYLKQIQLLACSINILHQITK